MFYCYREQQLLPPGGLPHCSSLPQQVFPEGRDGRVGMDAVESSLSISALPQFLHVRASLCDPTLLKTSETAPQDLH
jgi:hypothetical protein